MHVRISCDLICDTVKMITDNLRVYLTNRIVSSYFWYTFVMYVFILPLVYHQ